MTRRVYPTKAEIKRAVAALAEAAQSVGIHVSGVEMDASGRIRLMDSGGGSASAYDRWKAGQADDRENP